MHMKWRSFLASQGWLFGMFLVIVAVSWALAPASLSVTGISAMSVYGVEIGLIAFGEMLVILSGGGGIDLSVGSMFALSQVLLGVLVLHHLSLALAMVIALASGMAMGLVNGLIVTALGIPAIIVTLATMYAYGGLALVLTHGIDISPFPPSFDFIGQGLVLGLPFQLVAIYAPVAVLIALILYRTAYGWNLQLVGTNALAAQYSGVSVMKTRLATYASAGVLSAMAGIIDASRLVTARPDAGGTANLAAITIAVLGGTKLEGGQGSIAGTALATLAITWLSYSFGLANINSVYQEGAVGLVLLLTILAQQQPAWRRWFQRARGVLPRG
jgi:ribose/xylose/arabinose/galactoside ABC-type transport system permease subunit